MPIRPPQSLKRCRQCGQRGHKSRACPLLDREAEAKLAKAISCMTWIPQGASSSQLQAAEDDAVMANPSEEPIRDLEDGSDSEADFAITEADFLYVAGKVNQRREEYSVYVMVYDFERDQQFERQDIILSHPPLHVSWLDFTPSGLKGSHAAVCTMLPCVEIFDLDKKNDLRAVCCLGGAVDPEDQYKPPDPQRPVKLLPGSHTESVLSSDWNRNERSILATSSADHTIKLWDLSNASCVRTLNVHSCEVLAVKWHLTDRAVLLSSGLKDNTVVLSRADREKEFMKWDIGSTAECVEWHPQNPHLFVAGTADGHVRVYDARKNAACLYTFRAHGTGECNCITFNPHIEGLMATGSNDKSLALWDVRHGHQLIVQKELGVGEVFALEFNPNNPFLLLGGGSAAQELVWTISEDIKDCGFQLLSSGMASSSTEV